MTQSDIVTLASECGWSAGDAAEVLNTYVQTLTYGTSGAVIHMCTDFDYKELKPISPIYYCKKIVSSGGKDYAMLVPVDHQVHQKWYVTEFIDLETITHIWFFDKYKRKPRVDFEAAVKAEKSGNKIPETGPMNYTRIIKNMNFPTQVDPDL